MTNLNRYYNDLIEGCKESCSSLSKMQKGNKKDKMRKISSILDMKLFTQRNSDQSFIGRAKTAIINTKKQIMMLLFEQSQFPSTGKNVLEALKQLNGDQTKILQSGIIKCYQSILLIQQQDQQMRQNRLFRTLKNILQQLVRFSIIYNQYKKRTHSIQSQTQLQSKQQHQINQKIIKSIQIQVFKKQIYDIVIQYLDSERIKLKHIKQICRICQSKISIQQMTSHLEFCQKRYYQLQELQTNTVNLLKLQREIKQIQSCSIEKDKKVYSFICLKIDRICGENQPEASEIISIIGDLSELKYESDNDLIITYKKLINERIKILDTISIINKESYVKEQFGMTLGVHSSIEEKESRQTSLMKQKSTLSVESNKQKNSSSIISNTSRKVQTMKSSLKKKQSLDETEDNEVGIEERKVLKYTVKKTVSMNRTFKDFQILKFLGKGAFGKVYLVRRVLTHDYYAVKCIKMDNNLLQDEKKIQNLKNEHDIFRKISGQFLVKAAFSFSQGSLHMFFLEYMPGGDFGALLEEQVYLDQQVAQFYLAEIVLAIQHLHNLNIIHRDLKPQNLVFDEKGHLKLTDFGLSKQGITKKLLITKQKASSEVYQQNTFKQTTKTYSGSKRKTLVKRHGKSNSNKSIVGTPDYIAPQVLNGISTENQSIDWWSFGVIVYQTLIGQKPFGAQTIEKVFTNIRNMTIEYPPVGHDQGCISPEAYDLIQSLLNIDFSKRLGADSIDEIKQHKFFQGICWQKLKSLDPPLPVKIDKTCYTNQNFVLRNQIQQQMKQQVQTNLNDKILLDDYMRIDILLQKTLQQKQKVSNKIKQKKTKISYLYHKCVGVAKSMKEVPYI